MAEQSEPGKIIDLGSHREARKLEEGAALPPLYDLLTYDISKAQLEEAVKEVATGVATDANTPPDIVVLSLLESLGMVDSRLTLFDGPFQLKPRADITRIQRLLDIEKDIAYAVRTLNGLRMRGQDYMDKYLQEVGDRIADTEDATGCSLLQAIERLEVKVPDTEAVMTAHQLILLLIDDYSSQEA